MENLSMTGTYIIKSGMLNAFKQHVIKKIYNVDLTMHNN